MRQMTLYDIKEKGLLQVITRLKENILFWKPIYGNSGLFENSEPYQNYLKEVDELKYLFNLLGWCSHKSIFDTLRTINTFDTNHINEVFGVIMDSLNKYDETIRIFLNNLDNLQISRLDQAILCINERCYDASVVMAVSAIEFDLIKMIEKNPGLNTQFNVKIRTLGKVIGFISEIANNSEYQNITWIAELNPLLNLCNTYRIFSAHPKKNLSYRIAQAVLHLSFEFIIEKRIREAEGL